MSGHREEGRERQGGGYEALVAHVKYLSIFHLDKKWHGKFDTALDTLGFMDLSSELSCSVTMLVRRSK